MAYRPALEISTVVGCSVACSYCPQPVHARAYRDRGGTPRVMPMEVLTTALGKIPANTEVGFAGMAEPWLNPQATAMVEESINRGFMTTVFTTCVGMTMADIQRLHELRPKIDKFVVHLPDDAGQMKVKMTDEYLAVLEYAVTKVTGSYSLFGTPHPAVAKILSYRRDDTNAICSRSGLLPDAMLEQSRRGMYKTGQLACSACACGPIDHNVLLPNGDVVLCCMVYDLKHVIGNLVTGTYASLFESEEYQRVMRGLGGDESIDLRCRRCEFAVPGVTTDAPR